MTTNKNKRHDRQVREYMFCLKVLFECLQTIEKQVEIKL